ncbi:MAG TPA: ATP-binding cassette domain-containing protein [Tepidisphaeraceae bacterium]|jgi:osmoprotectant transport system ATP-binding protein
MLELRGVSKTYGPAVALHATDLRIEPGRCTALIGPSGCGKSTLLRLMTGLLRPDAGQVLFDGQPMTPANVNALRRQMGYVIQEGGLFAHLTARGNVALMARYLRQSPARIEARVRELAELTRLERKLLDRYPVELSGGQRQRVSLMRALMLDPAVLLLDEPLGALDPMVRHDLQTDLKRIFRELDKTVVLVTHDMGEAGFLGDDIVLLKAGRIVQRGTLSDLVHAPADDFVVRFINAQRSPLEAV